MNYNNVKSISSATGVSTLEELLAGIEVGADSDITPADLIDSLVYNSDMKYRTFDDESNSTHTYGGDAHDEIKFMDKHSNYNEIIESMTWQDASAFEQYAEGWFMDGQQYGGFKNMDEIDQRMTRAFDKHLDKSVIDEGIVVTRRATPELLGLSISSKPTAKQLQKMKGKVVYSPANLSTGVAKTGLTIGAASEKPIEYRIHIPAGSKGAGMWIGDDRINGWGGRQREFMTNRDSLYVIGDSKDGKDYKGRDVTYVDLYYIGRTKHKY